MCVYRIDKTKYVNKYNPLDGYVNFQFWEGKWFIRFVLISVQKMLTVLGTKCKYWVMSRPNKAHTHTRTHSDREIHKHFYWEIASCLTKSTKNRINLFRKCQLRGLWFGRKAIDFVSSSFNFKLTFQELIFRWIWFFFSIYQNPVWVTMPSPWN